MTEHLQRMHGQSITSWKASLKEDPVVRRGEYIKALKKADQHDYRLLIGFMKETR